MRKTYVRFKENSEYSRQLLQVEERLTSGQIRDIMLQRFPDDFSDLISETQAKYLLQNGYRLMK